MTNQKWDIESIKSGIVLFQKEYGRLPTAKDFDDVSYLPSARQIQRLHGGMAVLRKTLGYGDIDFTKGDARKIIATKAYSDGLAAEEELEKILVQKFGEPYVHTQKRYGIGSKNRYDFFIYAQNVRFGIDIFTTNRADYIGPNVRHKIHRYVATSSIPIIFMVAGSNYTDKDIHAATKGIPSLLKHSHMSLMNETMLLRYIDTLKAFDIPEKFKGTI